MIDSGQGVFLFVFASAVGVYGTLVGAGGGFLIVPMLLLIFQTAPQQATGTSLAVVFFNALSGTLSYARQKRIDYRTGIWFGLATVPGAIVGAYLTTFFTGPLFRIIFGGLLILLAIFLVVRPRAAGLGALEEVEAIVPRWHTRRVLTDASGERFEYLVHEPGGIVLSFFIGFISSIFGIGGGIIHVPALVILFVFPAHIATATSYFILTISSGIVTASHLILGNILFPYALVMTAGVILGAQFGARIARRLAGVWVVRLLSLALFAVGVRLIVGQLSAA